jgi:hypothetical protein
MNEFSYHILPVIHASTVGISRLRSYARLRSEDATTVICPTPVRRYDSGRISRLRSHFLTPFDVMTLVVLHGFSRWACRMFYHLNCKRLRMVGLDDNNILQLGHLVGSRLGGMHDSISIHNLSISRLRIDKESVHETRDQRALSLAWSEINSSIRRDLVPMQLRRFKIFECLVRRVKALCRVTMAVRTDHTWEKSSAQQTEWDPDPGC